MIIWDEDDNRRDHRRGVVMAPDAPAAIGPYNQAIRCGEFIFTAGQIPLDPKTMQVVGTQITEQTEQALLNLSEVLDAAGSAMRWVVKTTVFLRDMSDFAGMNEVYERHFPKNPPARSCVEVSRLPKDVRIEIECVAISKS